MHGEPKDKGVGGEVGFKGIVALREARSAWRKAIVNGAKEAEVIDLKAKFEATRDTYRNRGKKVGLRNIRTDENDPNKLKAEAVTISYPAYTVLARRGAPESTQEYSHATGVAAALVTSDGRLVIQHRAVKQIDPLTSRLRPGNDSYCDMRASLDLQTPRKATILNDYLGHQTHLRQALHMPRFLRKLAKNLASIRKT